MNVQIGVRKITTFKAEQKLSLLPPECDRSRGVYYWPDMDEKALAASRGVITDHANVIREKAKMPEAPVASALEVRDGELWVVSSYVKHEQS